MRPEIRKNPYCLLAQLLSPWKELETVSRLRLLAADNCIDWGALVYLANLHLCSPLLYVRLRQDDLLLVLPAGLQEYLYSLYCLNVERNEGILATLDELLYAFQQEGIESLLLKGAATFCDGLYGDPGARMMLDIDILQLPRHKKKTVDILVGLGYQPSHAPAMAPEGLPTDARHHHLPLYCKPEAGAGVEIHFKLIYGQANRGLSAAAAWENSRPVLLNHHSAKILRPTGRLQHNTLHALMPHCEFIRAEISLQQLTEFVCLIKRYEKDIAWGSWLQAGKQAGIKNQMLAYVELAHRLMGMPYPAGLAKSLTAGLHVCRIIAGGSLPTGQGTFKKNAGRYYTGPLVRFFISSYYYLHLPLWVWRNVCYTDGKANTALRLRYLFKKAMTKRSRAKIKA